MGRTNKQWRHTLGLGIEISAPDASEALRRVEDVRDALQARFMGSEIYPPRIAGSPSRIPGSPTFKHFLVATGRPTELTPFEDEQDLMEESLDRVCVLPQEATETGNDREARIEQAAVKLAQLLNLSIAAGWIPRNGSIADALGSLETSLGTVSVIQE